MLRRCIEVPDPFELRARLEAEGKFYPGSPQRTAWAYLTTRLRLHRANRPMWELIQPVDEGYLQEVAKEQLLPLEVVFGRHRADWSDPLSVLNWVIKFTNYIRNIGELRGTGDGYYPDPDEVLAFRGGVCRGLGILVCSILFSYGVPGVRLTEGLVGDTGERHIWATWFPPDGSEPRPLEASVIEGPNWEPLDHLPTYGEVAAAKYVPLAMAERLHDGVSGKLYLGGPAADGWLAKYARS